MGLIKRPLYKRERRAPRAKSVLLSQSAPIGLPDANQYEVARAIYAMCMTLGITIGRVNEYDSLKDQYSVIGKSRETGKVQDFTIEGAEVAAAIRLARLLNGGPMVAGGW